MAEKTMFVESLVMVECEKSKEVATNIIEILDGESLEFLQDVEKILNYYMKAGAHQDTIHRPLSSILSEKDEKTN